jgi:hypothetical protein
MKWLVGTLAVMGCVCALGCSGEISSEGKVLQVVTCEPLKNAPPEAIQAAKDALLALPSKAPIMERFEWGSTDHDDSPECHYFVVTFKDPESAFDRAYQQALSEVREVARPYTRIMPRLFLFHDATPHVRTTTHGHLRRAVGFWLKANATRDERQKLEDVIAALPKRIPAIERLEWGTGIAYNPGNPKPVAPAPFDGCYCVLFTFDSTDARDACLSHPAYKEFQTVLEEHRRQFTWEYVAQVE